MGYLPSVMMRKRSPFPGSGWYDSSFVPFEPVLTPDSSYPVPRGNMGLRRKVPIGRDDIVTIGDSAPPSDDSPDRPAAIARRYSDAMQQVSRATPFDRAPLDETRRPGPPERAPGETFERERPAAPPRQDAAPAPIDPEILALKERLQREAQRARDQDRRSLLMSLLPVLDNLDRSIAAATSPDHALLQGIRLVRDQFQGVLADLGAVRLTTVGAPFDPALHEAMALAPVDDPSLDGKVVDEWEAGYQLGDRLLRPARVRVGKLVPRSDAPDACEADLPVPG